MYVSLVGTTYIYSSVLCCLFFYFKVCICLSPRPSHCSHWRLCLIQKCSGWNTPRYISFELLIQGEMYLSLSHLEIQTQVFALQLWAGILLQENLKNWNIARISPPMLSVASARKLEIIVFPAWLGPTTATFTLYISNFNPTFLGLSLRWMDGIFGGKGGCLCGGFCQVEVDMVAELSTPAAYSRANPISFSLSAAH